MLRVFEQFVHLTLPYKFYGLLYRDELSLNAQFIISDLLHLLRNYLLLKASPLLFLPELEDLRVPHFSLLFCLQNAAADFVVAVLEDLQLFLWWRVSHVFKQIIFEDAKFWCALQGFVGRWRIA